ncbi:hypothetical protein [uncultured Microbacterium sp.]|uniref:hypothetical protein n=1 Tax=uncultured Microbacterium sp. TaxID=191216 RepID=UPI00262549C8|nr:hypothetical protein [uncultured Microbacterium sp.]
MISETRWQASPLTKLLKMVASEFHAVCRSLQSLCERPIRVRIFARFLPAFHLLLAVFGRSWMSLDSPKSA